MTLIVKPKGRGRWTPMVISIDGKRAAPLLIRVGQLIPLGGVIFRICEVLP